MPTRTVLNAEASRDFKTLTCGSLPAGPVETRGLETTPKSLDWMSESESRASPSSLRAAREEAARLARQRATAAAEAAAVAAAAAAAAEQELAECGSAEPGPESDEGEGNPGLDDAATRVATRSRSWLNEAERDWRASKPPCSGEELESVQEDEGQDLSLLLDEFTRSIILKVRASRPRHSGEQLAPVLAGPELWGVERPTGLLHPDTLQQWRAKAQTGDARELMRQPVSAQNAPGSRVWWGPPDLFPPCMSPLVQSAGERGLAPRRARTGEMR